MHRDEIAARLKAATPGPWVVHEEPWPASDLGREKWSPDGPKLSTQRHVRTAWEHGQVKAPLNIWYHACSPYGMPEEILTIDAHDAAFIANAPTDIGWLLERADALELALQDVLTWVPACTARDRARTALTAYRGTR